MSLLPSNTNANKSTYFFLLANASSLNVNVISTNSIGAGTISTVNLAALEGYISSLTTDNFVINNLALSTAAISSLTTSVISTSVLEADHISTNVISSGIGYIEDCVTSTLVANTLNIDSQIITATAQDLLLNGVPIATVTQLSNIADWSLYPAISTVYMENQDILSTNKIGVSSIVSQNISSLNIQAQNILAQNIVAQNLLVLSSFHSTISSSAIYTDYLQVSSGNASSFTITEGFISSLTGNEATISSITAVQGDISSFTSEQATISSLTANQVTISSLTVSSLITVLPSDLIVSSLTAISSSVSSIEVSSINGTTISNLSPSNWSQYPATQQVIIGGNTGIYTGNTSGQGAAGDLPITAYRYLKESAAGYSNTADGGSDIGTNSFMRFTAQNGNRGEISMTANPGYFNGVRGEINITANGGISPLDIGTGGVINITANTPVQLFPPLISVTPSLININAGSLNLYSGAIPSFVGLPGYTFIYANLGVSLCSGLPPSGFQVPGTTFLYGTAGVTIGSDLYANNVYPFSGYGSNDLVLQGSTPFNAKVQINDLKQITFVAGEGQINQLSTINGVPYPPPAGDAISTFSTFAVSTLTTDFISTTTIDAYNVSTVLVESLGGSFTSLTVGATLTTDFVLANTIQANIYIQAVSTGISTIENVRLIRGPASQELQIENVSTINNSPYPPPGFQNLSTFSTFFVSTLTTDFISTTTIDAYNVSTVLVESLGGSFTSLTVGATLTTDFVLANTIQATYIQAVSAGISTIENVSLIKGKLGENINFALGDIQINSYAPGGDIFLNPTSVVEIGAAPGSSSELLVAKISGVNTINNIPYPPPPSGNLISTFSTLFTSTLAANTISSGVISTGSITSQSATISTLAVSTLTSVRATINIISSSSFAATAASISSLTVSTAQMRNVTISSIAFSSLVGNTVRSQAISTNNFSSGTITVGSLTVTSEVATNNIRATAVSTNSISSGTITVSSLTVLNETVTNEVATNNIRSVAISTNTISTGNITTSTINTIPLTVFLNRCSFTSTINWPNISTTSQIIASTLFTVDTNSFNIITANASVKNLTNQFHDVSLFLTATPVLGGTTISSVSTVATLLNHNGSFANASITFRPPLNTAQYRIAANCYADANGVATVVGFDMTAVANYVE